MAGADSIRCSIDSCESPVFALGWCSVHYGRHRRHGDPNVNLKTRRVDKPCGWCGSVMTLKPSIAAKQFYCSKHCGLKARAVREGRTGRLFMVRCRGCRSEVRRTVRASRDAGEYCSRECYSAWKTRLAGEIAALRRIAGNWKPSPNPLVSREVHAIRRIARWKPGRMTTVRPCSGCGMKTLGLGNYSRKCDPCKAETVRRNREIYRASESFKASRRAGKAMRRAAERGVDADRIDPLKVFDRDGWKCHLCGCPTPKSLRGTYEDKAPELDHVIPLAAGGTHTWGNVKCSCRSCNGAKGATPIGQLGFDMAA